MRDIDLFQLALSLTPPWQVVSSDFDPTHKRLEIHIDFSRGSVFNCPECGKKDCKGYDTVDKKWRHMNFFEHEAYLSARVPRVKCPKCGVKLVNVPWARENSGFTLLFEALIMSLVKQMPVKAAAALVGEQDTRLWRVLDHYVYCARDELDLSEVRRIGIDETSSKRGHNYISVFVDLDQTRVIYATEGKGSEAIDDFVEDFKCHNGNPDAIQEVCCDMSPAFIKGVEDSLPNARLTFDKFHVMKIISDAVDEVRRQEQVHRPDLKKTRFIWLKNPENLKENQVKKLETLDVKRLNLKTARAYHIRLTFQEFWKQSPEDAESFLNKWYFWATHSKLEPIIKAARTVKRHWNGILRWFKSKINNGILEGLNSLIQSAKSRARGYRTVRNMVSIVYLLGGKLKLGLPT